MRLLSDYCAQIQCPLSRRSRHQQRLAQDPTPQLQQTIAAFALHPALPRLNPSQRRRLSGLDKCLPRPLRRNTHRCGGVCMGPLKDPLCSLTSHQGPCTQPCGHAQLSKARVRVCVRCGGCSRGNKRFHCTCASLSVSPGTIAPPTPSPNLAQKGAAAQLVTASSPAERPLRQQPPVATYQHAVLLTDGARWIGRLVRKRFKHPTSGQLQLYWGTVVAFHPNEVFPERDCGQSITLTGMQRTCTFMNCLATWLRANQNQKQATRHKYARLLYVPSPIIRNSPKQYYQLHLPSRHETNSQPMVCTRLSHFSRGSR
jgi:hypothetical protein